MADLDRAGGFDRGYLMVAGSTGTGWLDPAAMASFEYETGGNSAVVSMQYSYLPSWASFLVDQVKAREAGRALFDAVYQKWSALPAGHRPKLYGFGLSLGSYAAEAPFSGEADMANRTDGVLLAGPPAFNPLNREFTSGRDPGTPEVQPVFRDGRTVRFTNDPADGIPPTDQPWDGTRVLYLQHASDPIVWLSPDLILHRPDWLAEPAGKDVISEMTWIPFVTFWQVTMDMLEPVDTAPGHGHTYTLEFVDGWAALTPAGGLDRPAGRRSERNCRATELIPVARFPVAFGLTLGLLVAANVLANRVVPGADVLVGLALVAGLAVVAWGSGLTADDVGLARRTWGSGLRWGGAAAAIVAVGYGIAASIPAVRDAVADSSASWGATVVKALVVIPLATVIPEEFAFRGVLWGLLRRESGQRVATAVSSALFGVWHVLPALAGGAANDSVSGVLGGGPGGNVLLVVGTVVFTGIAGVVFCELRRRSGSLLAPILLHWAVNGFGELLLLMT